MTNEDAVKWLENLKHDIGKPLHSALWHYEQALDEIGELLEEQQAKWIPIKEQMPELKRCVLVYCPQFRNIYTAWTDGKRWYYFGHGAYSEMFEEPSHWMKTPSEP